MLGWLEGASARVLRLNPCVLLHDLRLRMRTNSVFWLILVVALLCAAAVALPFVQWAVEHATHGRSLDDVGEIGRDGMIVLAYVLLTLMLLILPAWAASGIAGERERDTLAVLRSTMLTASDVAVGKFGATVVYAAVLLSISLPFAAWCIMLGSVSPAEVAIIYSVLVWFCVCIAGIGTWMSALCKRVISAVIATYVVLIALFGGLILLLAVEHHLHGIVGIIFVDLAVALAGIVPAAISAWTVAALLRWIVARTGHLQGQKAQAVLGIVFFGGAILGLAVLAESAGVLEVWNANDLAAVNPYLGLIGIIDYDLTPMGMLWTFAAFAAAGCMGAVRCLRLREFRPLYVDDIFISAWRRIRSLRTAPAEA